MGRVRRVVSFFRTSIQAALAKVRRLNTKARLLEEGWRSTMGDLISVHATCEDLCSFADENLGPEFGNVDVVYFVTEMRALSLRTGDRIAEGTARMAAALLDEI
jgi:hypothetical protein